MENPPEESETVPYEEVALEREWTFWENYELKERDKNIDWSALLKDIFTFHTLIDFWQFWNKYPGSDPQDIFYNGERMRYFFKEKYRINAMNLFVSGVRPEWEDPKNKGGRIFIMEYVIQNKTEVSEFMKKVERAWMKLLLSLIGENLDQGQFINGIRFVDKTQIGRKVIFRFEIWFSSELPENVVDQTKTKYGEEFGCSGIQVKKI